MPSVGFELAIPASERPQTHTLVREATGIGLHNIFAHKYLENHEGYISEKYEVSQWGANSVNMFEFYVIFCLM